MDKSEILVQVLCVTYNQDKYIEQTIDSILSQKTLFKFQVVIADDASTDNTSNILNKYKEKYKDQIIYIRRDKNIGSTLNSISAMREINAPFIAFCDGDDYWCDDQKLQTQIDFLQNNQEMAGCFHIVEEIFENGSSLDQKWLKPIDGKYYRPTSLKVWKQRQCGINGYITIDDIIAGVVVPTSAIVLRWKNEDRFFPKWMNSLIMTDIPTTIMQCGLDKIGYIPKIMSVYRKNNGGLTNADNIYKAILKHQPSYISLLKNILKIYPSKSDFIKIQIRFRIDLLLKAYRNQYGLLVYIFYFFKNIYYFPNKLFYVLFIELLLGYSNILNINNNKRYKKFFHGLIKFIYLANGNIEMKLLGFKVFENKKASVPISSTDISKITALLQLNLRYEIDLYSRIMRTHTKTFEKYRGIYQGKDIVLVGTGPSVKDFKKIDNCIYIGVNKAYLIDDLDFDYMFIADYYNTKSYINDVYEYSRKNNTKLFYGIMCPEVNQYTIPYELIVKHNIDHYYYRSRWMEKTSPAYMKGNFAYDLCSQPLVCFASTMFHAMQFALWTTPRKIYLVGCDCKDIGHFYTENSKEREDPAKKFPVDFVKNGWILIKKFRDTMYPNVEIISINPDGLKDLFTNLYTNNK